MSIPEPEPLGSLPTKSPKYLHNNEPMKERIDSMGDDMSLREYIDHRNYWDVQGDSYGTDDTNGKKTTFLGKLKKKFRGFGSKKRSRKTKRKTKRRQNKKRSRRQRR
jgi:hypothetical protein